MKRKSWRSNSINKMLLQGKNPRAVWLYSLKKATFVKKYIFHKNVAIFIHFIKAVRFNYDNMNFCWHIIPLDIFLCIEQYAYTLPSKKTTLTDYIICRVKNFLMIITSYRTIRKTKPKYFLLFSGQKSLWYATLQFGLLSRHGFKVDLIHISPPAKWDPNPNPFVCHLKIGWKTLN